ncbi:MAG: VOC family protein [Chryseolinea sp.]
MISSVVPKLPYIDKQQTVDFYVGKLRFTLQSDYGDYLIMALHSVELHFFSYADLKPAKSDFMIYLRVNEDIEALYKQYQTDGVEIHPKAELDDKPWGQREFAILDPNGTLLTFGQPY